jgi:hypothetical protein
MGTGAQKKSASRLVRQVSKLEGLHLFFAHFFTHEVRLSLSFSFLPRRKKRNVAKGLTGLAQWVYDTTNLERVLQRSLQNPQEAELFNFDVTRICWDRYLQARPHILSASVCFSCLTRAQNFCYGLQRFVLKETDIDYVPTTDTTVCLVSQPLDNGFFADMKFAYYSSPTPFPVERPRISMDGASGVAAWCTGA